MVQLLCRIMEVQCFIWILIDGWHSKMQIPPGVELKRGRSPQYWTCRSVAAPLMSPPSAGYGSKWISLSILFDGVVVFVLAYFCLLIQTNSCILGSTPFPVQTLWGRTWCTNKQLMVNFVTIKAKRSFLIWKYLSYLCKDKINYLRSFSVSKLMCYLFFIGVNV